MPDPAKAPGEYEVTLLLRQAAGGNREAFDHLFPLVYDELRRVAAGRLRHERTGHTLNTTALVHEAYIRLVGQTRAEWRESHQFFVIASDAMRRILIDYANRRRAAKRGGNAVRLPLDDVATALALDELVSDEAASELIALDRALRRLADFDPRGAQVVQYRFFGGLSVDEVGQLLGVSRRTVERSWTMARAWLRRELEGGLGAASTLLGLRAAR